MKPIRLTIALLILLASCSGGKADLSPAPAGMRLLYGTAASQVSLTRDGSSLVLNFQPTGSGAFIEIETPWPVDQLSENWSHDEHAIHLLVPHNGRLQIGVAPTADYAGEMVSLRLDRGEASRSVSEPPTKQFNKVHDLLATDLGNGQVKLDWTQLNLADYDLNGQVNISDLTPLGQNFGKQGNWTESDPEYWIDGDQNGEINLADITPIAQNYLISIGGYNIYRDNVLFPALGDGMWTAGPEYGTKPDGLPLHYAVTLGSPADGSFTVAPVDYDGVEGIISFPSMLSLPSLNVDLNIIGQQLFDQNTGLPSSFTNDTVILRVIDPIKEVNAIEFGTVFPLATDGKFTVNGLPRAQLLHLQIAYLPTVDLGSGAPKGGSAIRGTSAIPDDAVITSIPFRLPPGADPGAVNALIELGTANPAGGFFVELLDDVTLPGDNPATLPIEDGWTRTEDIQLDFKNSKVTIDTDGNGDFEDEPHLEDSNRDCVSGQRREQELDDDDDEYENRDEIEVEGDVVSFDETAGSVTLTNVEVTVGEIETDVDGNVTLFFSELSNFEERIRTDDDDIEQDFDPSTIMAGDKLEIDLYALEDTELLIPTVYWTEKVKRVIDNR
jgi:hypothetical protein